MVRIDELINRSQKKANSFVDVAIRLLSKSLIALHDADKALQLAEDSFGMANTLLPPSHFKMSWCKLKNCQFDRPLLFINMRIIITDMNSVGECYRSRGEYDNAISWHEKSRQLLTRSQFSPLDLATSSCPLSVYFIQLIQVLC